MGEVVKPSIKYPIENDKASVEKRQHWNFWIIYEELRVSTEKSEISDTVSFKGVEWKRWISDVFIYAVAIFKFCMWMLLHLLFFFLFRKMYFWKIF